LKVGNKTTTKLLLIYWVRLYNATHKFDDVVKTPMHIEAGMVKIPEDPSLGVIIGEEKVARTAPISEQ